MANPLIEQKKQLMKVDLSGATVERIYAHVMESLIVDLKHLNTKKSASKSEIERRLSIATTALELWPELDSPVTPGAHSEAALKSVDGVEGWHRDKTIAVHILGEERVATLSYIGSRPLYDRGYEAHSRLAYLTECTLATLTRYAWVTKKPKLDVQWLTHIAQAGVDTLAPYAETVSDRLALRAKKIHANYGGRVDEWLEKAYIADL